VRSVAGQPQTIPWLVENGSRELELMFRAILCHPPEPILLADSGRHCADASAGASKLLGISRDKMIGHLDD
jgi:formate hydrogenlyase transcriptional activator